MGEENGKNPSQNRVQSVVDLWPYISAQKETTTWDFEVYYEVIGRLRLKHRSRPARNADFSALFLACFFLIMFMHLVSWFWIRFRFIKFFSVIENDSSWGRLNYHIRVLRTVCSKVWTPRRSPSYDILKSQLWKRKKQKERRKLSQEINTLSKVVIGKYQKAYNGR